jgi:lysophospholipase L1-like esterase
VKKVLLLGDSIRLLYEPVVREKLKGRAEVYGPAENGRWSGYTLNSLRFWLPTDSPWSPTDALPLPDIVHWNNGIWDMGDDYGLGQPFTSPEEYVSALERTITVLRKLCGESVVIIMATTTPTAGTNPNAPHEYNDLLRQVAARHGVAVNDLFAAIATDIPAYISPDGVHLTPVGVEVAAELVADAIDTWL